MAPPPRILLPAERVSRRTRLRRLPARLSERVLARGQEPGAERLYIGPYSFGHPRVRAYRGDTAVVRIGAFCSLADDALFIVGGNHRTDWVSTFPFRGLFLLPGAYQDGIPIPMPDIRVGNDAWIGTGSVVLPGLTIGDGAIVGAQSVVTRDVRPYAIVAGNPAREVRRRFSDEQVDALLRIRWWNWPISRVLAAVPALNGGTVDEFITAHDPGP